jgi:hypothetical protein
MHGKIVHWIGLNAIFDPTTNCADEQRTHGAQIQQNFKVTYLWQFDAYINIEYAISITQMPLSRPHYQSIRM